MKKSTKVTLIALAMVVFYLFFSWVLSSILGNNIQSALAAMVGTYTLYDASKTLYKEV